MSNTRRKIFDSAELVTSQSRCFNNRSMESVRLSVCPDDVLVDRKVSVQVSGLEARQNVTVYTSVKGDKGVAFASCGCYQATTDGRLDLESMPSSSGTYTGIDGMGFIWSMLPSVGQRPGVQLLHSDVTKPQIVDISVYNGHLGFIDLCKGLSDSPVAKTVLKRWYKSQDVSRIPITSGRIRGSLFVPNGDRQFPGIIDIVGLEVGVMENRAALLASHGYVVMALPYYGYEDLPKHIVNLDLQYFKEAVTFMDTHIHVKPGGLGIIANSKGAEFAQLMAIHCDKIKYMVSVNGMPYITFFPIRNGDVSYPPAVKLDLSSCDFTDEGVVGRKGHILDTEKFIKVWESDVKILSICGSDDLNLHPDLQQLRVDCFPPDKRDNIELVTYKGAGHLIEPPFTPHCRASYNKLIQNNLVWGGNPIDHAYAQDDSWRRILHFLTKHFHGEDTVSKLHKL
ncbi:acyl-coenzyme A amino acid N-acyltransferase 1-like [Ylistrum balloti]|uniref:acyl-coenzyme A amino acid N-acyltransferase 1-like n=1 Tax=Ylistrum balloti TaxID=509963 RepID=UPI002905A070|nr:acyl-coenzyme A amino acid N-acyltransferase 1-like [Ylistrum balloti]